MKIELTKEEEKVLWRYRKHLWDVAGISQHTREVLHRIIMECNEEISLIKQDLKSEHNRKDRK